jgi:hypothetical protein
LSLNHSGQPNTKATQLNHASKHSKSVIASKTYLCTIHIIIAHAVAGPPVQLLAFIVAAQALAVAMQQPAGPYWWAAGR